MNTCKMCKWWTGPHGHGGHWDKHGDCTQEKVNGDAKLDGMHAGDIADYPLMTGPDFGCIHWEAKP